MILAQMHRPGGYSDRVYGIRDGWSSSTSYEGVLWLIGILVAILVAIQLARLLHRWWRAHQRNDPHRLFRELLRPLPLTVPQRDLLARITRDLRLSHPAVILLSPGLFIAYTNRWMSYARRADMKTRRRLDQLAATLFPPNTCPTPIAEG